VVKASVRTPRSVLLSVLGNAGLCAGALACLLPHALDFFLKIQRLRQKPNLLARTACEWICSAEICIPQNIKTRQYGGNQVLCFTPEFGDDRVRFPVMLFQWVLLSEVPRLARAPGGRESPTGLQASTRCLVEEQNL